MRDETDYSVEEQLSTWMDEELGADESRFLLRRLERDSTLRDRFERYHLIGNAIRNNLPPQIQVDFSKCVAQRLANENLKYVTRSWRGVGMGIAASLAITLTAAIILINRPITTSPTAFSPPPEIVTTSTANNVSPSLTTVSERPRPDRRIDRFLARHNELLVRTGEGGMVPYVRVADYSLENNIDEP